MKYKQTAWAVYSPNGRLMTTTVSMSAYGAKKRLLDPIQQKYHALVEINFEAWEQQGYVCKRVVIYPKEKGK